MVGELHGDRSSLSVPADEEIVLVFCLRECMIELSNSMKHLVKMLLNSGTTGNYILDAMAAPLKMQVYKDEDFHGLTLANETIVLTHVHDELWGLQEQNCG